MSQRVPPQHVAVFGRPGSGKSSLAERLSADHGYALVRTGELLRQAVRRRDSLGSPVEGYLKSGALVPDDVVAALVARAVADVGDGRLLFDGFPRTLSQVGILDAWEREKGYRVDCFLDVDIRREAAIARMGGRRVCPACGATYHMVSHPPLHDETCDLDGTRLERRKDDDPEVIEARQRVFEESTEPVVAHYRTHAPGRFRRVDGEKPLDAVYAESLRALALDA
ncbi:Adenylate kinase [Aquisphaera giovannonii]|uniref:Adenylate kinase n=1 Tax=Aquisphaera giovannonii TaxID=406548 RepID=A0A5B9VU09_9BACT|nr:nucleoside monophosphate kinase [Aquisphaera giovannonii]QEH31718.1 Adenylate kinase [Aquisphaera giovannonii]